MKIISLFLFAAVIVASCDGATPRPNPIDIKTQWVKYCSERPNCGLCTSQSNCAYCPATKQCLYYSASDLSAKTGCPTLVNQPELCK